MGAMESLQGWHWPRARSLGERVAKWHRNDSPTGEVVLRLKREPLGWRLWMVFDCPV